MALLYYFKSFDGMFALLLKEKESLNLDVALAVAIKIEKNVMAAHQVRPPFSRLFDPHARRVQDPQAKGLPEPKEEVEANKEELPAKIFDLLHDLSNKVVKMEKNMQSQQNVHTNQKSFQQRRPFQHGKKTEASTIPVPMTGNNYMDYLSSNHYCHACKLSHNEERCVVFCQNSIHVRSR